MTESSTRFRDFALRLLEHEGALVESLEGAGLEALLPAALQAPLRVGELLRLGFGAEPPMGALRASLESDWLERFGLLLDARGQALRFAPPVSRVPPPHPERLLEHTLTLPNAVYRLQGITSAWTRYLILLFRYSAISDEKREGVVKLAVNLANGSMLDPFVDELLAAALNGETRHVVGQTDPAPLPAAHELPPDWTAAKLKSCVTRALPTRVREQLVWFLTGMQRRLDRDLERIGDYYEGLRRESFARQRKQKGDAAREQLRIEAATREYQAKAADLKQKYDLRVTIELSQALELIVPVERLHLAIKRRKGERKIGLDWNPIARRLEPLPDEWSYTAAGARIVCDEALHLVAVAGHAPCVECGKEYCRACHPLKCPRCRQQAVGSRQ